MHQSSTPPRTLDFQTSYFMASFVTQKGNVLFISLILLAVLSILGLSSMRTALTEEKIARNIQDLHLAQESAESGLRHGQRMIKNNQLNNNANNNGNFFNDTASPPLPTSSSFTAPNLTTWNGSTDAELTVANLNRPTIRFDSDAGLTQVMPKVKIERFFDNNDLTAGSSTDEKSDQAHRQTGYYRILSRGVGLGAGQSEVILESIVITGTR